MEDDFVVWVDQKMLDVVFVYASDDDLDHAFTKVGTPQMWSVSPRREQEDV